MVFHTNNTIGMELAAGAQRKNTKNTIRTCKQNKTVVIYTQVDNHNSTGNQATTERKKTMDAQTIMDIKTDAELLKGAINLLARAVERRDSMAVKENRARVAFWAKSISKRVKL